MQNEGMKRRVFRYQYKIEHIRKLIEELKRYVDTVELKPVSEEAIIELERHLKKKLSDEYVAFLYYIGSGRLDYTLYHPSQVWEEYRSNCFLEKTNRKHGLLENIKLLSINTLEEKVKQESDGIGIR